ncbi:MAG: DUF547 domain-containing protein [Vicinamibacterales bacterium]|nr:DUF547 domain-containing protein [Vicinamibacterales bacterium]
MTRLFALVLLLLMSADRVQTATFDHEHGVWTELLQQYVTNDGGISQVDYRALLDEEVKLNGYLESLSRVSRAEFDGWTEDQRLAFLINAYNGFTVRLVMDHFPVKSIKDIGGWFSSPWKKRFFQLLGDERHLDDIEHGMIRKDFDEPRIYFAVNCAATGCPPLRAEAYVAARLDEQLEDNTRRFLRDTRRNRYSATEPRLELSSVMDWYRDDFTKNGQSLHDFVASRMGATPADAEAIVDRKVRMRFLDYDWSLNNR